MREDFGNVYCFFPGQKLPYQCGHCRGITHRVLALETHDEFGKIVAVFMGNLLVKEGVDFFVSEALGLLFSDLRVLVDVVF